MGIARKYTWTGCKLSFQTNKRPRIWKSLTGYTDECEKNSIMWEEQYTSPGVETVLGPKWDRSHTDLCTFSLPHLKMAPSQTLPLKQECHLARNRPLSLLPFLEPWFRDFAQEYRQALRMESSKALLKGNSSLRKILRKNEDLDGKQLRGGP